MTVNSICIVALDAYPLLTASTEAYYVGGESVQHVLLAHAWRDMGIDVSMIVHDQGQPAVQTVSGIRTYSMCARDSGIRVVRFFHPRMTSLVRALKTCDADVYYQSPAGVDTGIVSWFCQRRGKRFVFRIASDVNCIPGKQLITYWRDRKLFEYGLRHADLIASQTHYQQSLLRENYQLESEVVNMAADIATPCEPGEKDIDVLWVSNFREVKRPEAVLEIARALPNVRFSMVGGMLPGGEAYYKKVAAEARLLPNITVHGAVPYHEVGKLYDRARLFLNTSTVEGFPNSFLQAWMRGVPVVSTFDPDGLVNRESLGVAASSIAELSPIIRNLLGNATYLLETGERAHQFAIREFSATGVAKRYLDLLDAQ
ncbi:MAG: glycosyltransferase family 4 protein [Steroidobacteraceae bacterium]